MDSKTKAKPDGSQPGVAGVKHIIAIASGKGGVGKSTVATNLAVALQHAGHKVGLMDADVYGPSQPGMLGSREERPGVGEDYIVPVTRHGVAFVSVGLLMSNDAPLIWRAPMATRMIQQFIGAVMWGELDYLLIDLPPGTGDVQLTLAQQASLTGALIVTTPQTVALEVARKGLRMFEQVKVPIAGVIENMSGFVCKHCGKETEIFKTGGGREMARELGVPFLGALPLDPEIMMSGEDGVPVLTRTTESPSARALATLAQSVAASIGSIAETVGRDEPETIEQPAPDKLRIVWPDDQESIYSAYDLRINCSCAACIDENSGRQLLDTGSVPLDIEIKGHNPVGRYGLAISFSDGHSTGIYTYQRLRGLGEQKSTQQGFSV